MYQPTAHGLDCQHFHAPNSGLTSLVKTNLIHSFRLPFLFKSGFIPRLSHNLVESGTVPSAEKSHPAQSGARLASTANRPYFHDRPPRPRLSPGQGKCLFTYAYPPPTRKLQIALSLTPSHIRASSLSNRIRNRQLRCFRE